MRKYSKSFIMVATFVCGIGLMTSCCNDTDDSQEQREPSSLLEWPSRDGTRRSQSSSIH